MTKIKIVVINTLLPCNVQIVQILNTKQALIFLERSIVYEIYIYIYAIFIEISFEGKYSFIKQTTRSRFFPARSAFKRCRVKWCCFSQVSATRGVHRVCNVPKNANLDDGARLEAVRRPLLVPSFIVFPSSFPFSSFNSIRQQNYESMSR